MQPADGAAQLPAVGQLRRRRRPCVGARPAAARSCRPAVGSPRRLPPGCAAPSWTGGNTPRRSSACRQSFSGTPANRARSSRSPTPHSSRLFRSTGSASDGSSCSNRIPTSSRCRRKPLAGWVSSADQVRQVDVPARRRRQRRRQEHRNRAPRTGRRAGAAQRRRVEGEWAGPAQRARRDGAGVDTAATDAGPGPGFEPVRRSPSVAVSSSASSNSPSGTAGGRRAPVRSSAPV